jgi:hypothetical protein
MPLLKYVGPHDAVEVIGFGEVKRGDTLSVPAAVAGRSPSPRLAVAMVELDAAITAIDHDLAKALREEIIDLDHGDGLLAQPSNWEAVKAPTKKDEVAP